MCCSRLSYDLSLHSAPSIVIRDGRPGRWKPYVIIPISIVSLLMPRIYRTQSPNRVLASKVSVPSLEYFGCERVGGWPAGGQGMLGAGYAGGCGAGSC